MLRALSRIPRALARREAGPRRKAPASLQVLGRTRELHLLSGAPLGVRAGVIFNAVRAFSSGRGRDEDDEQTTPESTVLREEAPQLIETSAQLHTGEIEIPQWALEDSPVWLECMSEFLLERDPPPTLLDVDETPLIPDPQDLLGKSGVPLADALAETAPGVLPDEILRDYRYIHIPKSTLRMELRDVRIPNATNFAIFSGSGLEAAQAEAILREEGFERVLNVRTYRHLRTLVRLCARR